MWWERRRESLCQRQRWHSGSELHILCFSYLISKNTFFSFFFLPGVLHVSGLLMCTCCFDIEAERKHAHFVVSFFFYEWPFTLEMYLAPQPKSIFVLKVVCSFIGHVQQEILLW